MCWSTGGLPLSALPISASSQSQLPVASATTSNTRRPHVATTPSSARRTPVEPPRERSVEQAGRPEDRKASGFAAAERPAVPPPTAGMIFSPECKRKVSACTHLTGMNSRVWSSTRGPWQHRRMGGYGQGRRLHPRTRTALTSVALGAMAFACIAHTTRLARSRLSPLKPPLKKRAVPEKEKVSTAELGDPIVLVALAPAKV